MSIQDIKNSIRDVPDFPKKGILFKDITTALKKPIILREIINSLAEKLKDKKIDYIVGIESRGFIFGSPLAYLLNCGFVPIRKSGKLPSQVITQEYGLEYGTDIIEIHQDAFEKDANVLIIDDLLATGGTAVASAELVKKAGANLLGFAFVIELTDLNGREKLEQFGDTFSLIKY